VLRFLRDCADESVDGILRLGSGEPFWFLGLPHPALGKFFHEPLRIPRSMHFDCYDSGLAGFRARPEIWVSAGGFPGAGGIRPERRRFATAGGSPVATAGEFTPGQVAQSRTATAPAAPNDDQRGGGQPSAGTAAAAGLWFRQPGSGAGCGGPVRSIGLSREALDRGEHHHAAGTSARD
jgi:hypothetical protein